MSDLQAEKDKDKKDAAKDKKKDEAAAKKPDGKQADDKNSADKAKAEAKPAEEKKPDAAPEAPKADPAKTRVVQTITHTSPLIACRFDPTGRYVFAGAQDSRVWRFDLGSGGGETSVDGKAPDGKAGGEKAAKESADKAEKKDAAPPKAELNGHESWVRSFAFSPDGQTLVTGGYDGRLVWWPATAEKPEPLRSVEAHAGWIRAVATSPDGGLLASVGNDLLVRLWNMSDGSLAAELPGHESHIYNVAFHPRGEHLVTGDLKGNFLVWELKTAKEARRFTEPLLHKYDGTFWADIGGPRGMAFSADGSQLAACGITNVSNAFAGVGNPTVMVFDWESGKRTMQHLPKGNLRGTAWGVVLHPQGFTIASTGGSGGFLLFWKPDAKEEFHKLKLAESARDLALHPDGLQLALPLYNRQLVICRMG